MSAGRSIGFPSSLFLLWPFCASRPRPCHGFHRCTVLTLTPYSLHVFPSPSFHSLWSLALSASALLRPSLVPPSSLSLSLSLSLSFFLSLSLSLSISTSIRSAVEARQCYVLLLAWLARLAGLFHWLWLSWRRLAVGPAFGEEAAMRHCNLHCRIGGDGDATARPVATRIGLIALTADGATVRSSDQFGVWSVICFMDTEINNEKIN